MHGSINKILSFSYEMECWIEQEDAPRSIRCLSSVCTCLRYKNKASLANSLLKLIVQKSYNTKNCQKSLAILNCFCKNVAYK